MREIKYRAFQKEYKRMFEVKKLYIHGNPIEACWINENSLENNNQAYGYVGDDIELMQFTGLKDKNGKDIYEGDILRISGGGVMPVVYLEKAASFCLSINKEQDMIWFETDLEDGHYEVIGNIYENPNLLKCN